MSSRPCNKSHEVVMCLLITVRCIAVIHTLIYSPGPLHAPQTHFHFCYIALPLAYLTFPLFLSVSFTADTTCESIPPIHITPCICLKSQTHTHKGTISCLKKSNLTKTFKQQTLTLKASTYNPPNENLLPLRH